MKGDLQWWRNVNQPLTRAVFMPILSSQLKNPSECRARNLSIFLHSNIRQLLVITPCVTMDGMARSGFYMKWFTTIWKASTHSAYGRRYWGSRERMHSSTFASQETKAFDPPGKRPTYRSHQWWLLTNFDTPAYFIDPDKDVTAFRCTRILKDTPWRRLIWIRQIKFQILLWGKIYHIYD